MRRVKTRKTSDSPGKSGSLVCNEYITPTIIKFNFWQRTAENPKAFYACINKGEACCPEEIAERSVCMDGDIADILNGLH